MDRGALDAPGQFHPQHRLGAQPGPFGGDRGPLLVGSPHGGPGAGGAPVPVGISRRHGTRSDPLGSPPPQNGGGLGHAGDTCPCPACLREAGTRHWVSTFPWWHLFRLAAYPVAHAPGHIMRTLEAVHSIGMGCHSFVWSGCLCP